MSNVPNTGDIWEFTTFEGYRINFLIGPIKTYTNGYRGDRVTLIPICDTTPEGVWKKRGNQWDERDLIAMSKSWRRVA